MSYVYLLSLIPEKPELELNDVGIIKNDIKSQSRYLVKFLRTGIELEIKTNQIEFFNIKETGDRFEYKICDRCFKRLNTELFFSNNRLKKGNVITKRPSCKLCRKVKDGVAVSARERLKWEHNHPKVFSSFTCPICNKTTIVGLSKIVLDHEHQTGNVRGWLCESCNTGIGRFDDDPSILRKAIEWLEKI